MAVCPNCGEDNPNKFRLCGFCGARLHAEPSPPQEARKTVTVLFCDLVGSTALGERLDSESLREVMDRYFTEIRKVLERHGGIVEKYIGDAIMAIFGLPRAHEDDALRAVRSASEMRVALERLNAELDRDWGMSLANRAGINTGEVVVGDPSSGLRLATGDAVNVAARLEQAAPPNAVLLGEATYRLVKDAVSAETVEPLRLKGKSDRLAAFRLAEVRPEAEGIRRRLDAPLVGRSDELAALLKAFEQVTREKRCHLVTVLGEAGVGKSRLILEVAQHLRARAVILKGRCLSYGEGITFWPLAEIVREAASITDEDSAEKAGSKVRDLLAGTEGGIADRVASMVGLSSVSFPIEESFWAARRSLEHVARDRPLVALFEDIHWAEPTLLDWIAHVVDLAQGPILVLCAARPELRDEHLSWGQSSPRASLLDLQPLTGSESEVLIDNLLGASGASREIRSRITATAQGNPLFVEQIISMWIDDGTLSRDNGSWRLGTHAPTSIPPTISALLAARLDRLDHEERTVIAGASVVGHVFYRGAVEELCPPVVRSKVPTSLSVLEVKQFIRGEASTFADEPTFAFRHILIRDAAYAAILKRARAELHERFASWLENKVGDRLIEFEEVLGYHLEQAVRYRQQLAPADESSRALALRAARMLAAAGRRAHARGDIRSTMNLLTRAKDLFAGDTEGLTLLPILASALWDVGRGDDAKTVVQAAINCSDERVRAHAIVVGALTDEMTPATLDAVQSTIPVFQRLGDEAGLARAWHMMGVVHWGVFGRIVEAEEAWRESIVHGERANDPTWLTANLTMFSVTAVYGPTPVDEALAQMESDLEAGAGGLLARSGAMLSVAELKAMKGEFDAARTVELDARAILKDLGYDMMYWACAQARGSIEMQAGDPLAAESVLREAYDGLNEMGEKGFLSTIAGLLAEALCVLGRLDEAMLFTDISEKAGEEDDFVTQMLWRRARAAVLAQQGEARMAEDLAREAVAIAEPTEFVTFKAETSMTLGDVLHHLDRSKEALPAWTEALRLFTLKGNVISAASARTKIGSVAV